MAGEEYSGNLKCREDLLKLFGQNTKLQRYNQIPQTIVGGEAPGEIFTEYIRINKTRYYDLEPTNFE